MSAPKRPFPRFGPQIYILWDVICIRYIQPNILTGNLASTQTLPSTVEQNSPLVQHLLSESSTSSLQQVRVLGRWSSNRGMYMKTKEEEKMEDQSQISSLRLCSFQCFIFFCYLIT